MRTALCSCAIGPIAGLGGFRISQRLGGGGSVWGPPGCIHGRFRVQRARKYSCPSKWPLGVGATALLLDLVMVCLDRRVTTRLQDEGVDGQTAFEGGVENSSACWNCQMAGVAGRMGSGWAVTEENDDQKGRGRNLCHLQVGRSTPSRTVISCMTNIVIHGENVSQQSPSTPFVLVYLI